MPAQAGARRCPGCGVAYGREIVICIPCGIRLETGERIETRYESEPESEPAAERDGDSAEPEADPAPPPVFVLWLAAWLPGLLHPLTLILSLLAIILAAAVAWLSLLVFSFGAVLAAIAMGAAGLVLYAQAVAWILIGEVRLLHDALMDFDTRRWGLFLLFIGGPFFVGIAAIKTAIGAAE